MNTRKKNGISINRRIGDFIGAIGLETRYTREYILQRQKIQKRLSKIVILVNLKVPALYQ